MSNALPPPKINAADTARRIGGGWAGTLFWHVAYGFASFVFAYMWMGFVNWGAA